MRIEQKTICTLSKQFHVSTKYERQQEYKNHFASDSIRFTTRSTFQVVSFITRCHIIDQDMECYVSEIKKL